MITFLAFPSVKVILRARRWSGIVEFSLEDVSLVLGRADDALNYMVGRRDSLDKIMK